MAEVTLSFDAWGVGRVIPAVLNVPIVAPNAAPKLETVSKRLRGELSHPKHPDSLFGLRFSPDGKRLLAGGYPDHVVAVWDIASGRILTTMDTRADERGGAQLFVSSDWQTLFVPWFKQDYEQLSRDRKQLFRWEMDGGVRTWDIGTGQSRREFKHQPPRGVMGMDLSPDGRKFLTFERRSGTFEGRPKTAASLWDVGTGDCLQLAEALSLLGRFAPDGKTLVLCEADENNHARTLKVFDAATGAEKRCIAVTTNHLTVFDTEFSPDGRMLVGDCRLYEAPTTWDKRQPVLKLWHLDTGREVASFAGNRDDGFSPARFSPDGRILAVTTWLADESKLILYSVAEKQPFKTLVLGKKQDGQRVVLGTPVFSPDGKRLVVIARRVPDDTRARDLDPRDVPQPRIHLVDVTTGEIEETLVAPSSFMWLAAFSPDGRTLATGGQGKVLLWDVASPDVRR